MPAGLRDTAIKAMKYPSLIPIGQSMICLPAAGYGAAWNAHCAIA
jgi:hypothetical protein